MVQWLTTLKGIKEIEHLSRHFILKIENQFMVFTSKPLNHPKYKDILISQTNILGENRPQYLFSKIHNFDNATMFSRATEHSILYYQKHSIELHQIIEKIQNVIT